MTTTTTATVPTRMRIAHAHVQCHVCGRVLDVPPEAFEEVAGRLRDDLGFVLDTSHAALLGTCRTCAGRSPYRTHVTSVTSVATRPLARGPPSVEWPRGHTRLNRDPAARDATRSRGHSTGVLPSVEWPRSHRRLNRDPSAP